ncbi:glycosyltransferase family 2 protein [Brumimicrobium aurantiacum]|uniref:Glycosyltransferase n=1 Tax=Brumimicrobium aurantiacum TaxID=1737063 RepID=A0A3E1EX83_9FLAO|nr:glycosyltransferase family 2 protein [Brumimicrobium aurantiacum]RFC54159.1 glycosyltransferase [Brumimicrobium aurantiacum]
MDLKTEQPVISIIVPIYNEEEIIPELYERLQNAALKISENYELIFVNDGSRDNSLFELIKLTEKDHRVYYINFSRNFGHQIAVTAGLDASKGDCVAIIDGDLQDPPEVIPELHSKYKEGYEVVYAKRKKRKGESVFKLVTAKLFYRILKRITSVDIPVDTGDFRLIDRKVVDYLKQMPEKNKFLRGQIAWLGFNQTEVLFNRDKRKYGKTGYSISKMFRFAMDGITSFSDKPLQFVTKLGFFFSMVSFIIILYAFYSHFILGNTITGWTSLIISTMFIGGIQLISIGVIGAYVSRINTNIMDRPLYIIEKSNLPKK